MSEKPKKPAPTIGRVFLAALGAHGVRQTSKDLHVETVDLSKDRSTASAVEELTKLGEAIRLTVYKNNGTFDLYINAKDDYHKLNITSLTWPSQLEFDAHDFKKLWIGNTAQASGTEAVLIAWKR